MGKTAEKLHYEAQMEQRFGLVVAHFMKRYRPTDHYEAFDFEREMMNVIAAIYNQAQAPFVHEWKTYRDSNFAIALTPLVQK